MLKITRASIIANISTPGILKSSKVLDPVDDHELVSLLSCSGKEHAEKENLKEMGDVSSGMASTIIQIFLKVRASSVLKQYCL